ncbi:MAG TPA: hypothetical protein VG826_23125 [Pirellulales bacterium]|nr:hypothetical protein [Pirellulales bacterium]
MSPSKLGAIFLALFAARWLIGWLRGPVKLDPLQEGASLAWPAILLILGVGLVAYHFVVYRKYQDDIDPDGERRE